MSNGINTIDNIVAMFQSRCKHSRIEYKVHDLLTKSGVLVYAFVCKKCGFLWTRTITLGSASKATKAGLTKSEVASLKEKESKE